jgi:phage virion morphogenesis protein
MGGIKLTGDWSRFDKKLQKLVFFDFTDLHKEIGEALVSSVRTRFRKETGPDGRKWPKSHRAETDQGQTLTDTARLKNSISARAQADGVEVGTNLIYAGVHQGDDGKDVKITAKRSKFLRFRAGGSWAMKKSVTIPARPFIGISQDDLKEIQEILNDRIEEALK